MGKLTEVQFAANEKINGIKKQICDLLDEIETIADEHNLNVCISSPDDSSTSTYYSVATVSRMIAESQEDGYTPWRIEERIRNGETPETVVSGEWMSSSDFC